MGRDEPAGQASRIISTSNATFDVTWAARCRLGFWFSFRRDAGHRDDRRLCSDCNWMGDWVGSRRSKNSEQGPWQKVLALWLFFDRQCKWYLPRVRRTGHIKAGLTAPLPRGSYARSTERRSSVYAPDKCLLKEG